MAYEKQEWKDGEDGGTPITAERLNHIEEGIANKAEQGPKGDPGENGAKGDPGDKGEPGEDGKDGADGFGTEEQYNDIISRLETLEELISD